MRPRKHQKIAVRKALEALSKNARSQVVMACGTGKTAVGAWIAEGAGARKILVLLPSLALVSQTYEAYTQILNIEWAALAVCSDRSVTRHYNNPEQLHCEHTQERSDVEVFMRKRGTRIVFCTYQSAEKLQNLKFDLAIFDEAHKTTGVETKQFAFCLEDANVKIKRRLFMTATPRKYRGKTNEVFSMDSEETYGKVSYSMPFRKAVEQGIICDYKIVITVLNRHVDTDRNAAVQVAMAHAVKKYGLKSIFSYHPTISEAQSFLHNMDVVMPDAALLHINGSQTWNDRQACMEEFENAPLSLLTNSRCLIEGVDVPSVDLVAFTAPKKSVVDISQAAGRCTRKDPANPAKKFGYLLVPIFVDEGEDLEAALERTRFHTLFEVVNALREQDDSLEAQVSLYVGTNHQPYENIDNLVFEDLTGRDLDSLKKAITLRIVNGLATSVDVKRHALLELAKGGGEKPSCRSKDPKTKRLANALSNYTGRRAHNMYDPDFKKLLKDLRPDWFHAPSDRRKEMFLARARAGDSKPDWQENHKEAELFHLYIKKTSKVYDPKFVEALQGINPDWLISWKDRASINKRELLRRAKAREPVPNSKRASSQKEKTIYKAFSRYTSPSQDSYDEEFHMEIFALRPDWFVHRRDYGAQAAKARRWAKQRSKAFGLYSPKKPKAV